MQMAIDVAGFTAGRVRPAAPGHGLQAQRGEDGAAAGPACTRGWPSGGSRARWPTQIYDKLVAFANFGFPESHSVSFAYLVYSSAWLQVPLPGGVLRRAAGRAAHGVLVAADDRGRRPPPRGGGVAARRECQRGRRRCWSRPSSSAGGAAVRMGISYVRGVGDAMAERIAAGRPYRDMEDLVRRTGVTRGPGGGAGHRRGVRVFRLEPAGRPVECGGGAAAGGRRAGDAGGTAAPARGRSLAAAGPARGRRRPRGPEPFVFTNPSYSPYY